MAAGVVALPILPGAPPAILPAVTKRTRGAGKAPNRRPGARPQSARPIAARPIAAIARPSQLEAAEIVAEDVLDDKPASAADELRSVARGASARARAKPGSLLAARAATEYVYVSQDLRKIGIVAAILFGVLIVLWLVLVVLRVSSLY